MVAVGMETSGVRLGWIGGGYKEREASWAPPGMWLACQCLSQGLTCRKRDAGGRQTSRKERLLFRCSLRPHLVWVHFFPSSA